MDMMELDGLGQDVGSLFGIDGLAEDLMDVGVMGVSAGASVVVGELLFDKVPFLKDLNPWAKAGVAVVLGAAGGIAAGRFVNKAVGAGVAAGLVGWGVSKAVQKAAGLPSVSLGQSYDDTLFGVGQSDSDLLLGLGEGENVSVEDFRPLPGQTMGLSQAGDVESRDLMPLPGGGFISGVGSFLS